MSFTIHFYPWVLPFLAGVIVGLMIAAIGCALVVSAQWSGLHNI